VHTFVTGRLKDRAFIADMSLVRSISGPQEVPEMYGLRCDEKTGLPWVVCDGADNEKTKEYSSKEPMQRMTFQVCNAPCCWIPKDAALRLCRVL
jgi:hypothetical protein